MNVRQKLLTTAIISALATHQLSSAATITVNTTSDGPVLIGSSDCTLRLAVEAANTNSAQAGCAAGSAIEPDVILFDESVLGGTITLQNGDIAIESSMTIEKPLSSRRSLTISGADISRIFSVFDADLENVVDVTLRGLTLANGRSPFNGGAIAVGGENLTIDGCTLQNNSSTAVDGQGGAISNYGGELTLRDSTLSGNTAQFYGGAIRTVSGSVTLRNTDVINNSAAYGGGLLGYASLENDQPIIDIQGSTFSDNRAEFDGGAIRTIGTTVLSNTTFSNNSAERLGGGVFVRNTLVANNVEFTSNSAEMEGGAIYSGVGTSVQITNSQLVANSADLQGGGIFSQGITSISGTQFSENVTGIDLNFRRGGAIAHVGPGLLDLTESSLSFNAATIGGGISASAPVSITNSSFSSNSANSLGGGLFVSSDLVLNRSTLAANTANNGAAAHISGSGVARIYDTTIYANSGVQGIVSGAFAALRTNSPLIVKNSTLVGNAPSAMASTATNATWIVTNTVIFDSAITDCFDQEKSLDVNRNNFFGDGSCTANAVDFQVGDPMLGPLENNGGMTFSHAPLSGSPLVDAGTNTDCANIDQTGTPRPIDGNSDGDEDCDIGSVEFLDLFPPLATLSSATIIDVPGATLQTVEITYTELDGEVDTFSAGIEDITVLPGPLLVQSVSISGTASQLTVAYTIAAPGGSWDAADSGSYTVSVNPDEVLDTATTGANAVAAGELGIFVVAINEIDVRGNGNSIADGDNAPSDLDNTRFNDVPLQNNASQSFSIINAGGGTLNLTQPIEVFGQGLSVIQPTETALSAGQSVQFQVVFEPTVVGEVIGQITIVNNDSNESPYTFAVQANGVAQLEEVFSDGFENP
ncbi:MAG: choice-of-anchor Q domain-containing protein [Lysobacterales bacterium]